MYFKNNENKLLNRPNNWTLHVVYNVIYLEHKSHNLSVCMWQLEDVFTKKHKSVTILWYKRPPPPPHTLFYALCPAHQEQVCLHGIRLLHKPGGHWGATDTKTGAGPKPGLAQTGSAVPLATVSLSVTLTVSAMILTNLTPPDLGFSTSPMSSDDVQWNVSFTQPNSAKQSMVNLHLSL